jgi:GTPase SAR1 family protein
MEEQQLDPHYQFRMMLIGATETGKSSITSTFVEGAFSNEYSPTIGNIFD